MACFNSLKTKYTLANIDGTTAYFYNTEHSEFKNKTFEEIKELSKCTQYQNTTTSKNIDKYFFDPGTLSLERITNNYITNLVGMTLFEFQIYLESHGGSILVPITQTKSAYVYIKGQRDYDGSLIG